MRPQAGNAQRAGVFVARSVQLGAGTRRTSCRGYPKEGSVQMAMEGKDDQAIRFQVPTAPSGAGPKHLDRPTRGVDGFELTIGKETMRATVGRPTMEKRPPLSRLDLPASASSGRTYNISGPADQPCHHNA